MGQNLHEGLCSSFYRPIYAQGVFSDTVWLSWPSSASKPELSGKDLQVSFGVDRDIPKEPPAMAYLLEKPISLADRALDFLEAEQIILYVQKTGINWSDDTDY